MHRIRRWHGLMLVVGLLGLRVAQAATIAATTCSRADVGTAVTAASAGDTVTIPTGSCSWSTGIALGSKALTIQGNGSGNTLITFTGTGEVWSFTQDTTLPTRLTGCGYFGATGLNRQIIGVGGAPGSATYRIDHNAFFSSAGDAVFITASGNGQGLIDHNHFESDGAPNEFIHNEAYGNGVTTGWTNDVTPGSIEAVYIEDNTFQYNATGNPAYFFGSSAVQSYYGARTVFRYNQLSMMQVDQHGTPGAIGARWWEIYENTFTVINLGSQCCYLAIRAGSGVIFNNHQSVNAGAIESGGIDLFEEDTGYPALYQIGRGKNQVLDPAYVWGNDAGISIGSQSPTMVQVNRDYFLSAKPSYTPFTYPHPAQGSTGAAVTNLRLLR